MYALRLCSNDGLYQPILIFIISYQFDYGDEGGSNGTHYPTYSPVNHDWDADIEAIINGQNADRGEYPWQILIGRGEPDKCDISNTPPTVGLAVPDTKNPSTNPPEARLACGGTLIHPRVVMTASHCFSCSQEAVTIPPGQPRHDPFCFGKPVGTFKPEGKYIEIGRYDLTSNADDIIRIPLCQQTGPSSSNIDDCRLNHPNQAFVVNHPLWTYDSSGAAPGGGYDITLIFLPISVNHIQPVRLNANPDFPSGGDNLIITGWGCTSIAGIGMPGPLGNPIQEATMTYVPNAECTEPFGGPQVNDRLICQERKDFDAEGLSCPGDSGMMNISAPPVFHYSEKITQFLFTFFHRVQGGGSFLSTARGLVQVGITSYGDHYITQTFAVTTRVSSYREYIEATVAQYLDPPVWQVGTKSAKGYRIFSKAGKAAKGLEMIMEEPMFVDWAEEDEGFPQDVAELSSMSM